MKPSVLVTGGCGYIGSHVVKQLSESGYRCVVLDDLSNGSTLALLHDEVFIQGNIGDQALLKKIFSDFKIEAILHFAAFIVVPESVRDPSSYYDNNFVKTKLLLDTALAAGVDKIIFSSTAAVYGICQKNEPVTETEYLMPINPYGRSKLMVEWLIQDYAIAKNLKFTILRYFNVAGADESGKIGQSSKQASHLIKLACKTALGQQEILQIFGGDYTTADGTCVRDYIHVQDLANAHLLALDRLIKTRDSQIFNCGYGKGFSVLEVVGALEKVIGRKLPAKISSRREGDPPFLVASNNKLLNALDWKPKFNNLETIVRSALEWDSKQLQSRE